MPAALNIDGREIKFKTKTRYKQLSVLTAKLPAQLVAFSPGDRVAEAKIAFANGWSKNIRLRPATPMHGNTIVTHQKDHKIQWIKDWANYYRSRFYIQNVVIYDNNSANQQEVIDGMAGIATVIPWAFPFGITDRSGNNYCQVGAINHLKSRYARNATIFHFDMDELLVIKTDKAKRAVLSNRQTRFNSFWVPHSPDLPARYSFADYTKRYAQPRNGAFKHVVRSDARGIMNVHRFIPEPMFLYRFLPRAISRGQILPVTDAYFLHYMGITTNWNKHYDGTRLSGGMETKSPKSKELVDDHSIIDALNALPES
ncbi:MAG: glycosyltransferase family 2 protein [Gammaproteobacteria bacterium]|nr:glycosyltransferase family 2 protein [Gammaproteobacteria bacterium]